MTTAKKNYQTMSAELDTILVSLQTGELDIDEATKAYERGIQLVGQLEKYLKTAENKVISIKASFEAKKD